nr:S8 family serine peptidase [Rhodothermaceae bacterium]
PNLRADLSKSFVPGEDWTVGDGFYFNHGTHVAGIIGAADNGYGVIGVAPDVELIALKVLSEHTDSGDFSWLMAAIVYAANQGIDIANISIGTILPENGAAAANTSELKAMFDSVSRYANERGLFIVASAGEQHQNLDRSQVHFPSVTEHIVSVASTTPIGWLVDPYTSFFNGSSYSNYGRTGVDFVAPGGDASYPGEENCQLASIERPCWVFDFAFSTISDGWGWVTNTGAATAHAAGVAALYKSLHPDASPEDIRAALKGSAYKIGATPGKDEVFGGGHLNALGALSIHNNKSFALHQQESESFTLVREEIPTNFELTQNYPNPFNPLTTINFHLPEQSQVYVGVYDVQGRQVATLVDNELKAGCYDTYWNGRDENGNTVESGVYMYKIIANNYVDSKVMTFSNN